jgi:hypothetical protein
MCNHIKTQNASAKNQALKIFVSDLCFRRAGVLLLLGWAAFIGIPNRAQADNPPLYSTSFEGPVFLNGNQLLGADGWSTAIPPFLNPDAAIITNVKASNRKQSVVVKGADLIGSEGITAPYDAIGSYRKPLNYVVSADQTKVHVDADLLLETDRPGTPGEFFSLTIAARSGSGDSLGEVGLSSQGVAEAWKLNAVPGSPPEFVEPITLNQWHRVSMLIDYQNRTTSYYIDDYLMGTVEAPSASNVLARVAMVVYARPNGDATGGVGSSRSDFTARFDNFRVRVNNPHD